jgi:hypothetical protein
MTQESSPSSGDFHSSGLEQRGQQSDSAAGKLADEVTGPSGDGHGTSPEIALAKKAARLLREENVAVEDMLRTSPPVKKVKRG